MIRSRSNSGLVVAAVALVLLSACSNGSRNAAGSPGAAYKVGRASAELSRSARAQPARPQPRAQVESGRRAAVRPNPIGNRQAPSAATPTTAAAASASTAAAPVGVQTFAGAPSTPLALERSAAPESVTPTPARFSPLRLDRMTAGAARAMQPVTQAVENAAPWPWLAAIGAGFLAALALAWVLRPRRGQPPPEEFYAAPTPANDPEEPRRPAVRRSPPPPPKVTILAGAGRR